MAQDKMLSIIANGIPEELFDDIRTILGQRLNIIDARVGDLNKQNSTEKYVVDRKIRLVKMSRGYGRFLEVMDIQKQHAQNS